MGTPSPVTDRLARPLRDLRVSVTDRCNFRCSYCMPKDVFGRDWAFLERPELLTFEEIARVVRAAASLGVRKVRLTGGEPLLRRDLEVLVGQLAAIDGLEDIALTTNGALLARKARPLAEAGLGRVTVSLDALDDATFRRMNDVGFPVDRVLEGIEAARTAGLAPVKVNVVVRRGLNETELVPLVERFRDTGVVVRFIEYMDVGTTNGWRMEDVVPSAVLRERLRSVFDLEPVAADRPGDVAVRWRHADGSGEIGFVSSVTEPFCGACNRGRLSADGRLHTCLFASAGHDLKGPLRAGAPDAEIEARLASIWRARTDRYSEGRTAATPGTEKPEMSYIGG